MIRAKFKVESKTEHLTSIYAEDNKTYIKSKLVTIYLSPVGCTHTKNEKNEWVITESENTKFWKASPSGKVELGCLNLEVADKFELGKEYYVDFHPAE